MTVEAETSLGPEELLAVLKNIEDELGRLPDVRWGPRIIDLDILLYGDLVMKTPELEIPHPAMKDRDFVLKPLAEIAPDKVHPVFRKSMKELLEEISEETDR